MFEIKQENELAIVTDTVAPINLKPECGSELADEALYGMVVKLLEKLKGGWYYIETHYRYNGYIHEKHISIGREKAVKWQKKADCYIDFPLSDVMSEPKYSSFRLKLLTKGAFIHITGNESGKWIEIELADGQRGWIREGFAKKMPKYTIENDETLIRKSIIDTALSYMGTQYRWGGKSTLGIDCSGLASMAYMLNGFIIYRDAVLKEEYMKSIGREEMKPGDLLFFPGHVAVYLGEGKYVHSTGREGYVLINSLNPYDEDYREDLDKALNGVGTIFR